MVFWYCISGLDCSASYYTTNYSNLELNKLYYYFISWAFPDQNPTCRKVHHTCDPITWRYNFKEDAPFFRGPFGNVVTGFYRANLTSDYFASLN